jgi:PP-loop superfamily ATP-utilizing enzyme
MEKAQFLRVFGGLDSTTLKYLCYQALVIILKSGKGTHKHLERLAQLEDELGLEHLAEAA